MFCFKNVFKTLTYDKLQSYKYKPVFIISVFKFAYLLKLRDDTLYVKILTYQYNKFIIILKKLPKILYILLR